MNRAVFILGAGASAAFGVPTLLRIFQDPWAVRHLQNDPFLRDKLQELFWGPRGHTHATSHLSLSAEEILTIVRDYEFHAYNAPPLLGEDAERFKRSLYVLIKKAIYDGKHSRGRFLNPVIEFAGRRFQSVSWASFNWDCIFEASFYYSSGDNLYSRGNPRLVIPVDNWRNSGSKHVFLKLHGGINWWFEGEKLVYLPFGAQPDLNTRWRDYEHNQAVGQPVILEPSFYKYQDEIFALLKPQWEHFVKSLLEADVVVVIGYSLPEADAEARRALTIGFQSNPSARWIVIDKAGWVCQRYQRLFGSARLTCREVGLEDVGGNIEEIVCGGS